MARIKSRGGKSTNPATGKRTADSPTSSAKRQRTADGGASGSAAAAAADDPEAQLIRGLRDDSDLEEAARAQGVAVPPAAQRSAGRGLQRRPAAGPGDDGSEEDVPLSERKASKRATRQANRTASAPPKRMGGDKGIEGVAVSGGGGAASKDAALAEGAAAPPLPAFVIPKAKPQPEGTAPARQPAPVQQPAQPPPLSSTGPSSSPASLRQPRSQARAAPAPDTRRQQPLPKLRQQRPQPEVQGGHAPLDHAKPQPLDAGQAGQQQQEPGLQRIDSSAARRSWRPQGAASAHLLGGNHVASQGSPAAVDERNVAALMLTRDELEPALQLERALAGNGLSLLEGLAVRYRLGQYRIRQIERYSPEDNHLVLKGEELVCPAGAASSRSPHCEGGRPTVAELADLRQHQLAGGQGGQWTAAQVALLHWKRDAALRYAQELPLSTEVLELLAASLRHPRSAVSFLAGVHLESAAAPHEPQTAQQQQQQQQLWQHPSLPREQPRPDIQGWLGMEAEQQQRVPAQVPEYRPPADPRIGKVRPAPPPSWPDQRPDQLLPAAPAIPHAPPAQSLVPGANRAAWLGPNQQRPVQPREEPPMRYRPRDAQHPPFPPILPDGGGERLQPPEQPHPPRQPQQAQHPQEPQQAQQPQEPQLRQPLQQPYLAQEAQQAQEPQQAHHPHQPPSERLYLLQDSDDEVGEDSWQRPDGGEQQPGQYEQRGNVAEAPPQPQQGEQPPAPPQPQQGEQPPAPPLPKQGEQPPKQSQPKQGEQPPKQSQPQQQQDPESPPQPAGIPRSQPPSAKPAAEHSGEGARELQRDSRPQPSLAVALPKNRGIVMHLRKRSPAEARAESERRAAEARAAGAPTAAAKATQGLALLPAGQAAGSASQEAAGGAGGAVAPDSTQLVAGDASAEGHALGSASGLASLAAMAQQAAHYAQQQLSLAWQYQQNAAHAAAAATHAAAGCYYQGYGGYWGAAGAYGAWDSQVAPHHQHGVQIVELPAGGEPLPAAPAAAATPAPPPVAAPAAAPAPSAATAQPLPALPLAPAPASNARVPPPAKLPAVDVDSPFWDPTWQLEWRCLQLLHGGTRMPYYALLAAVGEAAVERLAYLWSGPDDTGGAILNRFLMRRPHLFQVVLGDTIQLAPGAQQFLRFKRQLLELLAAHPHLRAPVSELQAAVKAVNHFKLKLDPGLASEARNDLQHFLRIRLHDCVWLEGSPPSAELRPFHRPAGAPAPPRFAPHCFFKPCKDRADSCPYCHAPPRFDAEGPPRQADGARVTQLWVEWNEALQAEAAAAAEHAPQAPTASASAAPEPLAPQHPAPAAQHGPEGAEEAAAAVAALQRPSPPAGEGLAEPQQGEQGAAPADSLPSTEPLQASPSPSVTVDAAEAALGLPGTPLEASSREQQPQVAAAAIPSLLPSVATAGTAPLTGLTAADPAGNAAAEAAARAPQEPGAPHVGSTAACLQPAGQRRSGKQGSGRSSSCSRRRDGEGSRGRHGGRGRRRGSHSRSRSRGRARGRSPIRRSRSRSSERGRRSRSRSSSRGRRSRSRSSDGGRRSRSASTRGQSRRRRQRRRSLSRGRSRRRRGSRSRSRETSRSRSRSRRSGQSLRRRRSSGSSSSRGRRSGPARRERRSGGRRRKGGSQGRSPRRASPSHRRSGGSLDASAETSSLAGRSCWDPTWVLESQCVQQLCRDGSQAPAALLSGKSLPPFLFKDKRERDEAAFARFLRERPHLFAAGDGAGGERVKAVPGASQFLPVKLRLLDFLASKPTRRAPLRLVQQELEQLLRRVDPALRTEVTDRLAGFCRKRLADCVHVGSEDVLELRPCDYRRSHDSHAPRPGRDLLNLSFARQCRYFVRGYCKHGARCRLAHAPPRGYGSDRDLARDRLSMKLGFLPRS